MKFLLLVVTFVGVGLLSGTMGSPIAVESPPSNVTIPEDSDGEVAAVEETPGRLRRATVEQIELLELVYSSVIACATSELEKLTNEYAPDSARVKQTHTKPKPQPQHQQPIVQYNKHNNAGLATVSQVNVLGGLLSKLGSQAQLLSDHSKLVNSGEPIYGRSNGDEAGDDDGDDLDSRDGDLNVDVDALNILSQEQNLQGGEDNQQVGIARSKGGPMGYVNQAQYEVQQYAAPALSYAPSVQNYQSYPLTYPPGVGYPAQAYPAQGYLGNFYNPPNPGHAYGYPLQSYASNVGQQLYG